VKKYVLALIALLITHPSFVYSIDIAENPKKFTKLNPDGNKYGFVSTYIKGLEYIYKNVERRDSITYPDLTQLNDASEVKSLINNLASENANLRIAKNLLLKYRVPDNGLVLKVTDLFISMCDELVTLNQQERNIFAELYEHEVGKKIDEYDVMNMREHLKSIAAQRKESSGKLLQSAILLNQVLISSEPNGYGNFVNLGVTEKQRAKLIKKLDQFYGAEYEGELRAGQTFFQGSVATIRELLEDEVWGTLDG